MIDSICIFGDSIMKGVIFDAIKGRYIFLKNSFLNILGMRNTNIKVDNFAKFGCTITVGRKLIEKHAEKLPGYEYTALEFGGNDCDFDWKAISEDPDALHIPKTPIDVFEKNYSDIIDHVASKGSKPVLFSLPPLNAHRYFSWISRGLNADNILRWLGDEEHIYRWHEMYNIAVLKLAAVKGVALIDIRRAFLETRNYLTLLCEDGIHPNEAGHTLISEVIRKNVPALA
ncbi:MAG: SGNH/GDSL hydrolase family protein [Clostridiaceae bacterium]|nr:SGNH/GDSL hydrolase family protein [Clostridiaceae bacterium]